MPQGLSGEHLGLGQLYLRLLDALRVADRSGLGVLTKPLEIPATDKLLSPLRVYLFNCTHHPSERKAGDYRIQLRLPGQSRQSRGELATDGSALVLLVGYVVEFDVFVLWDAYAHETFPYSKGVQVSGATIHDAAVEGLAQQARTVRSSGYNEVVVAARGDHLLPGVELRRQRTRESLLTMHVRTPTNG